MKKTNISILICLITALLLCLTACNPVIKESINTEQLKPIDKKSIVFVKEHNSTYAVFPNIDNAKEYGYSFSEAKEKTTMKGFSSLDFKNGCYWGEINTNGIANGTFTLFASNGTNTIAIEVPFSIPIDINSIAPDAYISRRTENGVELDLNKEPFRNQTEYKVVINETQQEQTFDSIPMSIDGLEADKEYSLTIYHKLRNDERYGNTTQTIKVPKYDKKQTLTLSINEDYSAFVIMNPNEVANSKYILKLNGNTIVSEIIDRTVSFKQLGGMTSGNFHVEQIDNKGNIIAASNTISYITPLYLENPITTQQTYTFTLDLNNSLLQSINETNFNKYFSISINASNSVFEFVNKTSDKITLRISNLESKNDYRATLIANVGNAETSIKLDFKTQSFAQEGGTYYQWRNNTRVDQDEFTVLVRNSEEVLKDTGKTSEYKYYIYAGNNINDKNSLHRIMPLIDKSIGETYEVNDQNYINYDKASNIPYIKAYVWNNTKWNSSSFAPSMWIPLFDSSQNVIKTDAYTSLVESIAKVFGISSNAITMTKFEFKDNGTNQGIVFYNKITDGSSTAVNIGNKSLKQNPNPRAELGEMDKYHFYLSEMEGI